MTVANDPAKDCTRTLTIQARPLGRARWTPARADVHDAREPSGGRSKGSTTSIRGSDDPSVPAHSLSFFVDVVTWQSRYRGQGSSSSPAMGVHNIGRLTVTGLGGAGVASAWSWHRQVIEVKDLGLAHPRKRELVGGSNLVRYRRHDGFVPAFSYLVFALASRRHSKRLP